jgi:hypothetical protein
MATFIIGITEGVDTLLAGDNEGFLDELGTPTQSAQGACSLLSRLVEMKGEAALEGVLVVKRENQNIHWFDAAGFLERGGVNIPWSFSYLPGGIVARSAQ